MTDKTKKIILFLAFAALFASFANGFLSFKLWDYDVWWHLATGRYIAEKGEIPNTDPFSFVSNLKENKSVANPVGEEFNLKQYWLAQVIFYKIYTLSGDKGIILLRSFLLFLTVFSTFWWMRRQKISFYIIYPLIFLVYVSTLGFIGERPVLFTILLAVVVFSLLDDFKTGESRLLFLLIPVMLLWANLHGGFILGVVLIATYMAGETVNFVLKKGGITKDRLAKLYIIGFVAIGAAGLNPNGFKAFLTVLPQYKMFTSGTHEYYSPFTLYSLKLSSVKWELIAMLFLLPVILILRRGRIDIIYYLLLGGLFYMSVTAVRFEIYYVSIGAMVLGRELHHSIDHYLKKHGVAGHYMETAAALFVLASSLLFASGVIDIKQITFEKAINYSVPERAAAFISKSELRGNVFSDAGAGGYFAWRLYPANKVFIDTRSLNYTVMKEYEWIISSTESIENPKLPEGKKPLWQRLIDHYDVDIIALNTLDAFGTIPTLLLTLMKDEGWSPVFYDVISVVFVRDNEANRDFIVKNRIERDLIYNMLIARFSVMSMDNKVNPYILVSAGDVFFQMERYDEALKAYEYANRRIPGKDFIKPKIETTKKQIDEQKSEDKKKGS